MSLACPPVVSLVCDNPASIALTGCCELSLTKKISGFLDIPFALTCLEEAAWSGRFSREILDWYSRLRLFRRLFACVLADCFGGKLSKPGWHLVSFYSAGDLLGIGLIKTTAVTAALRFHLEFFALREDARGKGLGRACLKLLLDDLPKPYLISSECAPEAKAMKGLLASMGFRLVKVAKPIHGGQILPYRYELLVVAKPEAMA